MWNRISVFTTHKRKNLKHEQITSSPMHDLALGIYKSLMHLFFEFTIKLGVSKFLNDDVSKKLFELCNSNIDFLLTTMLNECKTTGWLASDFIRTMKMWLWMCRNVDAIIEKYFNVNIDDDGKKMQWSNVLSLFVNVRC